MAKKTLLDRRVRFRISLPSQWRHDADGERGPQPDPQYFRSELCFGPHSTLSRRCGVQAPLCAFLQGSEFKRAAFPIVVSNLIFATVHLISAPRLERALHPRPVLGLNVP